MSKLTKKEYYLLKSVNLKYNKYYTGNIKLKTKKQILEAIRLNLKIKMYDTLIEEWMDLLEDLKNNPDVSLLSADLRSEKEIK